MAGPAGPWSAGKLDRMAAAVNVWPLGAGGARRRPRLAIAMPNEEFVESRAQTVGYAAHDACPGQSLPFGRAEPDATCFRSAQNFTIDEFAGRLTLYDNIYSAFMRKLVVRHEGSGRPGSRRLMEQRRAAKLSAVMLRAALHDLAQPAAAAMLAAEITALELAQGNLQAAEARLATTLELLGTLQGLLRAYGGATPGGGAFAVLASEAMDPARVVADTIPDAVVMPCPLVAFSADLLRLVLRRLAQAFGAEDLRCRVAPAPKQAAVCIRLSGRVAPPTALTPWIALLRLGDAKVRYRAGALYISLPNSAGASCANRPSVMKR